MYEERAYDLVLGSDVLFYRGAAPHVANVVARCVREGGCALLGDPVRLNVDDFVSRLDDLGMQGDVRLFRKAAAVVAAVGDLAQREDAFVQLKKAKLVVITRRGEELSGSTRALLDVVRAATVSEEEA